MTTCEAEVAAWFAGRADEVIETSCARIFLAGGAAFKVKRPVDFGFLDFTTLERRRWAIERELALNRDVAPDIYRAVRRVTRTGAGLELDGAGEVIDYALEMRRFDPQAVLAAQPHAIDGDLAEALGRTIADFHIVAPLRPEGGGGWALKYTIDSNAELLRSLAADLGREGVEALIAATDAAFHEQQPLLNARAASGFARRCHGDLHLGNVLLEGERLILFDCIEFNDALSEIDVQYDLAFTLMDLDFRGRRDAAARLMSAYVDQARRGFDRGAVAGLAALPLMQAVRAGVRTHVSGFAGETETARAYMAAGLAHLAPPPPKLIAVGGLSGTGKSTLARLIAPHAGAAPGALVLRTDEIRKRLAGVGPRDALPRAVYTPTFYDAVYDEMLADAAAALGAGRAVVLDATFVQPALRRRAQTLAERLGVAFEGLWLAADPAVLAARVGARAGDASEATAEVLEMQLGLDLGAMDWRRLDDAGAPEAAAEAWRRGFS